MKNNYIKIALCIIIGILMISTTTFATSELTLPEETTQIYKRWQKLSDEEKGNYIIPQPYSLNLEDSVKMSIYKKITRGVGTSSNTESAYNLYNDVKFKIKDQKSTDECWAFVTTTAIETNVAKTRNKMIELSPRHIDYATSKTFLDGINKKGYNREIGFGNFAISFGYCTSGKGPVLESDMPFEDNKNKINLNEINKKSALKLENYVQFADIVKTHTADGNIIYTNGNEIQYTQEQVLGVRNLIKNHIKNYGAVTGYTYFGGDLAKRLNLEEIQEGKANSIAYYNGDSNSLLDHAITIVGWDDNYSKDNFNKNNKPKNDGAYLVVNTSAGTDGILSAMYISYEDVWIEYNNYGVVSTSDINYDTLYQYDEYGYNVPLPITNSQTKENATTAYGANTFTRKATTKEEYLNEVSVHVPTTTNVDIYVNSQNDDKTKTTKVASAGILEPGYHTIKLATPIKLTGDKFVIVAKFNSNAVKISTQTNLLSNNGQSSYWDNIKSEKGQSFISLDGQTWNDLNNMVKDSNICIKAFTTYQEKKDVNVTEIKLNKQTAEIKEGESLNLVATIAPSNATNKNIKWTSSNNTIATVTKEGIITALKEGTVTITATTEDGNKIATCTITVKGKINKEDNVYYEDNLGQNNGNNDSAVNINGSGKDSTVATGKIPQTGSSYIIIVTVVFIVSGCIFAYIKYKKYNDIK